VELLAKLQTGQGVESVLYFYRTQQHCRRIKKIRLPYYYTLMAVGCLLLWMTLATVVAVTCYGWRS